MRAREEIRSSVTLPAPPKRLDAAARAASLLAPTQAGPLPEPVSEEQPSAAAAPAARPAVKERPSRPNTSGLRKLTTRVHPEQLAWLQAEARSFRERHPRAPRLTIEELTRVAIEHLRNAPQLDGLISRYRGE